LIIRTALSPALESAQASDALHFVEQTGVVSKMSDEWVKRLDQQARRLYLKLDKMNRVYTTQMPRQLKVAETEPSQPVAPEAEVACVKNKVLVQHGHEGTPEFCESERAFYTRAFEAFSTTRASLIEGQCPPDQLWNSRFKRLAQLANGQHVVVVDRYAGSPHNIEGLRFVMQQLAHDLPMNAALTLYFGVKPASRKCPPAVQEIVDEADQIRQRRDPGFARARVTAYWCEDEIFGRLAHDRFIKFGPWTCALGNGLAVFCQAPRPQSYSFALTSDSQEFGYKVNRLRDKSCCYKA
jgi:hypothetical protein